MCIRDSGAGKSRAYAVVNITQCNCSMVITDPKGELLRKTGGLLEREGDVYKRQDQRKGSIIDSAWGSRWKSVELVLQA